MKYKAMYEDEKLQVIKLYQLVRNAFKSGYVCGKENTEWSEKLFYTSWVMKELKELKQRAIKQ